MSPVVNVTVIVGRVDFFWRRTTLTNSEYLARQRAKTTPETQHALW